ncbi:FGGY-family carbohydrate kinase [Lichenifustis flavocetrariae]|uniref:FGGY-family carbohydrate kinase n=1 Tax=Lichenifustis flavocetrariae TaxID=2949735 RepID=A0AA42CGV1_9HYPH|nr:FGGY-family carbohydrate kinase [Lichenifustis flavocetrariae]MCW6506933.1 FGGY-family carbohydrate kinase [Lichenifustis flavocetrariae]
MPCVIGLDIGTTSTIGVLLRLPDQVLAVATRPVTLRAPHPGWAEEDPAQWWANVCAISQELLANSAVPTQDIAGIGVTGMLPAVVLLDRDGAVLRPSIQQSDGRCGEEVEAMRAEWPEADFLTRAGNGINQQLVGAKLRWIETHEPDVFSRIATVFGSYDYINWQLTGTRAIEQNWALEAGVIDLATHVIDPAMAAFAHCPTGALPPVVRSHAVLGRVSAEAARSTGLPGGVPVVGGAADMIASALGAGVVAKGDILLKFGGSIDVLVATDIVAPDARMFLDYHLVPGLFMPNGCMSTGGSGLNWMVMTFAGGERAAAEAAGLSLHQHLDALAGARPAGAEGLTVLPYFLGEKTPIHDAGARGVFSGLTLSHDLGHLWRAMLEAYAYAIAHHVEVLNAMGHSTTRFLVSDGGSASRVWMQIVADVLQQPLQTLSGHLGSCIGAAWTAAVGTGCTDDWSGAAKLVREGELIQPDPAGAAVYAAGFLTYRNLYQRLAANRDPA